MLKSGVSRQWRLQNQFYRLTGQICTECRQMSFSPKGNCPDCALKAQPSLGEAATAAAASANWSVEAVAVR